MNIKKLVTSLILLITVVLALIAGITSYKLFQIGKQAVSSPAPQAKKSTEKTPEVFISQPSGLPCQLIFTVSTLTSSSPSSSPPVSSSPSSNPSISPSPSSSPPSSTSPNPSPSFNPSSPLPSSSVRTIAGASPLPGQQKGGPAEELPNAGITAPTILLILGGISLIALGLLL